MLELRPIYRRPADDFVRRFHRHSDVTTGFLFATAAYKGGVLVGVGIAGRPIARRLQDGLTVEVLRVCTDGTRNACSILYGGLCRASAALGYRLAITYTLASEPGASLRASGFTKAAEVRDEQWNREGRPREERDLFGGKIRWERKL